MNNTRYKSRLNEKRVNKRPKYSYFLGDIKEQLEKNGYQIDKTTSITSFSCEISFSPKRELEKTLNQFVFGEIFIDVSENSNNYYITAEIDTPEDVEQLDFAWEGEDLLDFVTDLKDILSFNN